MYELIPEFRKCRLGLDIDAHDEINIEDFMQYFNNNSTLSHVNVVISVSLINARKNSVFDTQTFSKKIKVKELNSRAGVEGLNIALNDVLKQSNLWLGDVCK